MSVSRVRENRTHGSTRRREATPDQSATAAPSPETSRRPYGAVAPWGTDRLLLWYGESDSAGPVILCASTPSHTAAASRADDVPWFWRFEGLPPRSARDLLSVLGRRPLHFTFWAAA